MSPFSRILVNPPAPPGTPGWLYPYMKTSTPGNNPPVAPCASALHIIHPGFAAIDLGNEKHFVATAQSVRHFGTMTPDLRLLSAWLRDQSVTRVAMEATGVLWMPVFDLLQADGFHVTLFNGTHARNLPGRKSDVQDCQWHAMLHSHGLLQPCFVAPEHIRPLRAYCRQREVALELGAASIQRMQRALDQMNLRIHNVISQLHGVSGLKMIDAILAGERDPAALVRLCDRCITRTKKDPLLASLEGTWQAYHLFELQQGRESYRFAQAQMAQCDEQIAATLALLNQGREPVAAAPETRIKPTRHNAPQIPALHGELLTLCEGHDVQRLPGLGPLSWLKLMAETGPDLSHWRTARHFTNWAGLSPGLHQSGRRRKRVPRRKTRVGQIFREGVMSLARSQDCALGAFYRRLKGRRGAAIANVATARKLAELFWRVMTHGMAYVEAGLAQYEQACRDQQERYLRRLAKKLNYQLQPLPKAA